MSIQMAKLLQDPNLGDALKTFLDLVKDPKAIDSVKNLHENLRKNIAITDDERKKAKETRDLIKSQEFSAAEIKKKQEDLSKKQEAHKNDLAAFEELQKEREDELTKKLELMRKKEEEFEQIAKNNAEIKLNLETQAKDLNIQKEIHIKNAEEQKKEIESKKAELAKREEIILVEESDLKSKAAAIENINKILNPAK